MVLSDASELQVGSYLRRLAEERGRSGDELRGTRVFAIALWHMVKAAELRDRAKRAVRMANAQQQAMQGPLDEWLAERVLSPEERAAYRAERDRG